MKSTQHALTRIRRPRVAIVYEVEVGNAVILKELPYMVGVIADLSAQSNALLPPLMQRKLIDIDRDNFSEIMRSLTPSLKFQVENMIAPAAATTEGAGEEVEKAKLNIEVVFQQLDDFHPDNLVKNIEPLRQLFVQREKLSNLIIKADGNDALTALLITLMQEPDKRAALISEIAAAKQQIQEEKEAELKKKAEQAAEQEKGKKKK